MAKVRIRDTGEVMEISPETNIVAVPFHKDGKKYIYGISQVQILSDGTSERVEFAKAAMQALLLRGRMTDTHLAKRSFEIADAMVRQLEK